MDTFAVILNYLLAFALGSIYSFAELIGRYSEPKQILKIGAGKLYIVFNGLISVFALLVIKDFNINIANYNNIEGGKILIAGTAAMLILRSSIASVKVGTKNVEGGLAPLIQVFLDAVNKSYDRERSNVDLARVKIIMGQINYSKAEKSLPLICLNVLMTLSEVDQKAMGKQVSELSKSNSDNYSKSLNLGIIVARYTGIDLLKQVVDALGESIKNEATTEPTIDELIDKFSK